MGSGDVNTRGWLALLFVIAIVSFVVLGGVIARREAHATAWARLTTTESVALTAQLHPVRLLARGVAASATRAARALSEGNATAAAVASDAVMRAAEVGRDGAPAASRAAFENALRLVRQARAQRQNGDPSGAATTLGRVPPVMSDVSAATVAAPSDAGSYDGARLINAAGVMIGVVDHVSNAASGPPATAVVVIGGYHHVLGFLDFGGTRLTVPVERLVFGKARTLGATHIVLATMAETASAVRQELGTPGS
jgi:hypothetical protein